MRDTVRTQSAWGRLYSALRDPLPAQAYRLGMSLQRIEQDADGVTAMFANGARERGDLLVGADGIRSTVRELMLPQVQPSYAGYVAWRAMLDEKRIPDKIRERIFEHYSFCLPRGRAVPRLPRARPQQRDPQGRARLQHRLVPAGGARSALWSTSAPMRPAVTMPTAFRRR